MKEWDKALQSFVDALRRPRLVRNERERDTLSNLGTDAPGTTRDADEIRSDRRIPEFIEIEPVFENTLSYTGFDATAKTRHTRIEYHGRPDITRYYIGMAMLAGARSTCRRRMVGCVLVDADNRVLSIGYNGAPSGFLHCLDNPCPGAMAASGTQLDACEAVHAEQSALVACREIGAIHSAYVSTAPCVSCTKLLCNTPCQNIFFAQDYPHQASRGLWERGGRQWIKVED